MDAREQCRFLSASITGDCQIDRDALEQAMSQVEDEELRNRLRALASTHAVDVSPAPARSAGDSPAQLAAGDLVADRYRVEAFLDRGGMGEVYRATDQLLGVPIALKIIRAQIAANPRSLRDFKQEVLLARSVSHPNVCRIYDLGWDEIRGVAYLTMEYLRGSTLSARLFDDGPIDGTDALPLISQMALGLDAAHRAGVIHRDFKSGNVMLVPDDNGERAVIMDFGLAVERDTDGASGDDTVSTRGIVGTPAYISPEQVADGRLSPASDLYALGVVLFEMVTGRLPFQSRTPLEMALAHVNDTPPSPQEFVILESSWEETILRLLSKEPGERFATAADVVLALEGRPSLEQTVRHSLPPERDTFVERTTELDALASLLEGRSRERGARLVTIQGPGGTGKTRLAQKYGWESLAQWPGGVWFCDLTEARSVDGIAHAVATAMNLPLGKEDPIVQIGHTMSGVGKSLIILDNFEQLVGHAEETLGQWLPMTTETRFLVTTQQRLQLPEETPFELDPLDPTTQGVELFEVRAQAHRPGFRVDESNREQVVEIVQRLDGLPLAIELAASRLRMLDLTQLRDRLEDRFRLLSGGKPGRHATLGATLDWSWSLLQPWEQSALEQVSVFEGGFTLEAAESVIDLPGQGNVPFILDVIQSLADKSWLRTKVALGSPRFEMYTTLQEYASKELRRDSLALQEVESRHGTFFARMGTTESLDALSRHGGIARISALRLELDNLTAACRSGMRRGEQQIAETAYLAAAKVLELRGPFGMSTQLGREVAGALKEPTRRKRVLVALASAERLSGNAAGAWERYEEAMAIDSDSDDRRTKGALLADLAVLENEEGRIEDAREHYEAALSIYRGVGNRPGEGVATGNLGILHQNQGRMRIAGELYATALGIHREVGNRHFEGIVLGNLGILHDNHGESEKARERYESALIIHREVGNRRFEGIVLGSLGRLCAEQGRLEEMLEHYENALAIHRNVGDRSGEGIVLYLLGIFHHEQGRMREAREYYGAAILLFGDAGNRRGQGVVHGNMGNLCSEQGRMEEALEHYGTGLTIHREVGDRGSEGAVLGNLANLHFGQGRMKAAREHYEAALSIQRELGNRRAEGVVLGNLGNLQAEEGEFEAARTNYETALSIHREVSNRRFEGIVLGSLGALHRPQDRVEEAQQWLLESISILREVGESLELGKVFCSLGEHELRQDDLPAAQSALAEAESLAEKLTAAPESDLARRIAELRQSVTRARP